MIETDGAISKDPNSSTSQDINTPDIDGGTIDNTVIGGTTAAAGTFTTLQANTSGTVGTTTAGANLTVNATRTSIFTHTAASYNEDGATWTITGTGPLVHVTGNTTAVTGTGTEAIVAGVTYRVTITGTGGGATATYTLGGVGGTTIAASGAIAIEDYITASTTGALIINPGNTCTVSITSVTIEKLTDATGDVTVGGNIKVKSQTLAQIGSQLSTGYPSYSFERYPTRGIVCDENGNLYLSTTSYVYTSGGFLSNSASPMGWPSGFLYLDASNAIAQRNSTTQQIARFYNTYTDGSNYERLTLTGVQGASVNLTAETAGTGGDNLDVILTPAGTGVVKSVEDSANVSKTANTGGGFARRIAEAVSAALSGASGSIAVNVPAGARILGCQLRVDTAITADTGVSWTAAYTNTPTTAITSGQAFTKSTKFNAIHPAYELTTDVVTITITPNAGTFTAGVIRAVVYYEDFIALSDAP